MLLLTPSHILGKLGWLSRCEHTVLHSSRYYDVSQLWMLCQPPPVTSKETNQICTKESNNAILKPLLIFYFGAHGHCPSMLIHKDLVVYSTGESLFKNELRHIGFLGRVWLALGVNMSLFIHLQSLGPCYYGGRQRSTFGYIFAFSENK